jgi:hypothetical protein
MNEERRRRSRDLGLDDLIYIAESAISAEFYFVERKFKFHKGFYFRAFTQLLDSSLNSAVTMLKIIKVNSAPLFFRIVWLFSCNP